jgi:hypothetical protein
MPEEPLISEHEILLRRREIISNQKDGRAKKPIRALALSGGGIRSATFSLGFVQAIADGPHDKPTEPGGGLAKSTARSFSESLLSSFDYLSTVSGGGYLGGFICSLFVPHRLEAPKKIAAPKASTPKPGLGNRIRQTLEGRLGKLAVVAKRLSQSQQQQQKAPPDVPKTEREMRIAANDAFKVLSSGVPSRIRRSTDYTQGGKLFAGAPLAWLRENGRYLTPTGMGDTVYAAALILRNWLSLHLVIGLLLVSLLAAMIWIRATAGGQGHTHYGQWEQSLLTAAINGKGILDSIWWSPLSVLCIVPLLTFGIWMGTAYWIVTEQDDGCSVPLWRSAAFLAMLVIGAISLILANAWWPDGYHFWQLANWPWKQIFSAATPDIAKMRTLLPLAFLGSGALVACALVVIVSRLGSPSASGQRQALTQGVAFALNTFMVLAVLAVIDTLGQSLYLASFSTPSAATLSPAGVAAALVWLARSLAKSGKEGLPDWMPKLPLMVLAGIAGMVIFILIGGLWAMFVHWLAWGGVQPCDKALFASPQSATLLAVAAIAGLLSFSNGFFAGFINQSSLQYFYASRLTRAYLGASNWHRFADKGKASSAAEPMAGDQLTMDRYYKGGIQTLAPIHIINVTVNKTVDPTEQLVQRDRKGLPLAVLPWGLSLDGRMVTPFPTHSLNVGQWIATSGAAFSTGIGRETSLGMSLLMGAANVRLGIWLDTGLGSAGSGNIPFLLGQRKAPEWLRTGLGGLFKTQRYLSYELRGRFFGTDRKWQYLSDGGHFENTAIFELLRPERQVDQIFACDNGADPDYEFSDLGNLIRLAKIDLGVDIVFTDPLLLDDGNPLRKVLGCAADFRRYESKPAPAAGTKPATDEASPCALLLYALLPQRRVTQIVLLKPNVTRSAPLDVREHACTHAAFPQDTTADQFFDEAQWESYRALGYWQGQAIFKSETLVALAEHHKQKCVEHRVPNPYA